ncbi:MAG: hypothetical protein ABI402_02675 [Ferruginibacter sp.]
MGFIIIFFEKLSGMILFGGEVLAGVGNLFFGEAPPLPSLKEREDEWIHR